MRLPVATAKTVNNGKRWLNLMAGSTGELRDESHPRRPSYTSTPRHSDRLQASRKNQIALRAKTQEHVMGTELRENSSRPITANGYEVDAGPLGENQSAAADYSRG